MDVGLSLQPCRNISTEDNSCPGSATPSHKVGGTLTSLVLPLSLRLTGLFSAAPKEITIISQTMQEAALLCLSRLSPNSALQLLVRLPHCHYRARGSTAVGDNYDKRESRRGTVRCCGRRGGRSLVARHSDTSPLCSLARRFSMIPRFECESEDISAAPLGFKVFYRY
ncbi:unnamed protein product [Pleuronectes platessa]|uniref:Uncharacterized protein n=1 Tax=Pleuronectes platessa TaxID=8262 RepID=A0A9N7THS4_PLEPL|nr:unnamed protein product [Pleuronectes platessa]